MDGKRKVTCMAAGANAGGQGRAVLGGGAAGPWAGGGRVQMTDSTELAADKASDVFFLGLGTSKAGYGYQPIWGES